MRRKTDSPRSRCSLRLDKRKRGKSRGWRWLGALAAVLTGLSTGGCWDNHELEDQAFITIAGLDESGHNSVKLTFQYMTPSAEGPKHQGSSKPLTTTFLTPSLGVATNIAETTTDRLVTGRQLKVVILSEKMAKKEQIMSFLEGMVRERDYRRDILLLTSVQAPDVIIRANRSRLGSTSLNFIENMRHQYLSTAMFPETTLNDFLIDNENGDNLALTGLASLPTSKAVPTGDTRSEGEQVAGHTKKEGGDNEAQFLGAEVYAGGQAVGRLTGREVRAVLLLRGRAHSFLQSIRDPFKPQDHDTLQLYQLLSPHLKAHLDGDRLHFVMDIPLYATLGSTTSQVDYVQNDRLRQVLAKAYEKQLAKMTLRLFKRSQQEFGGDIFHLARAIKMRYWTEQDWKAFNYTRHYRLARLTVRYHVHLKDFGKQRYPYGT